MTNASALHMEAEPSQHRYSWATASTLESFDTPRNNRPRPQHNGLS
eukprot:CAMPEP_0203937232 /NCGR_PEP_ID=MMETSP0359-20131031/74546_1 /ASSEMBLY_ACC=CAM_ASM_000338 /TAXON_ID=268821 /ORGANISM="Scrippsiella Hangoei, Strain SHTV-5" /LENGTH=45 /DNA_ID= /DNA_START= /DNA_END= /DNA_ORIENTATION=